jgi:hypothetical protein
MQCCETCGRRFAPRNTSDRAQLSRVQLSERADLDRAYAARELTKDQYFAECKRIGLRDDLRFFIRVTGADLGALAAEAGALLAQLEQRASKRADALQINSLRDRYRVSRGSLIVRAAAIDEAA